MVDPAGSPVTASAPRTAARLTRARLVAIGIGLALGVALGAWYRFLEDKIPTSFLSPTISAVVVGIAVLGLLGLSALVLSLSRRTRFLGRGAATAAVALVVGLPIGYVVGPRSQLPRDFDGNVDLEIAGTPGSYSGSATCRTVENGNTIVTVLAEDIGTVGGFPLSVNLSFLDDEIDDLAIQLTLAGGSDFGGIVAIQELSESRSTGTASFSGLVADDLDPDPPGGWTAPAGTVRWTCG